ERARGRTPRARWLRRPRAATPRVARGRLRGRGAGRSRSAAARRAAAALRRRRVVRPARIPRLAGGGSGAEGHLLERELELADAAIAHHEALGPRAVGGLVIGD